jgi:hypothetical protein
MKKDIKNLQVGDQIILKDEVTLKDMLNEGRGLKGAQETITAIREFKETNSLFSYKIYHLEGDYPRFLLLKMVDQLMDIRIYMYNGWLNPGTREDWVNQDHKWLFAPPANENNFKVEDLEFGYDFRLDDFFFEQKQNMIFGELRDYPPKNGIKYPLFAGIKEYIFSREDDNRPDCTEVLVIDTNGWCEFLEGWRIDLTDYEIFSKH